jgi:UDP-glucuronate 4-epimerase
MKRPARICVTGAAGFIGSTLVDRLLSEGREVVGIDNFDPFYPRELKLQNLEGAMRSAAFRLEEVDLRDAAALERIFSAGRFGSVVHLAALAGVRPSLERPAAYVDVNVNGTTAILEAATRHGSPRVVFASSSSVYGERDDGPFSETDRVDFPVSPYAATKRAGELIAHSFHHGRGLSVSCVRFFTAYGPRQRPDLAIRKFSEKMLRGEKIPVFGDGSSLRDFTFIDDVVDGLCRATDKDLGFAILNFGAGRKISVKQMIRELERALEVSAEIDWLPPQTGDVPRTWANVSAARKALGYEPRVAFEEGIDRFVAWLKQRKEVGR